MRRPGDMPVINRNSCASALPTAAARPGGVRGGMDKGSILLPLRLQADIRAHLTSPAQTTAGSERRTGGSGAKRGPF